MTSPLPWCACFSHAGIFPPPDLRVKNRFKTKFRESQPRPGGMTFLLTSYCCERPAARYQHTIPRKTDRRMKESFYHVQVHKYTISVHIGISLPLVYVGMSFCRQYREAQTGGRNHQNQRNNRKSWWCRHTHTRGVYWEKLSCHSCWCCLVNLFH